MNELKVFQIGSETEGGISYRYIISDDYDLVESNLKENEFIDTTSDLNSVIGGPVNIVLRIVMVNILDTSNDE